MMWMILGLLFVSIALIMDKAFKTELSPVAKYGMFAFAAVFILVDVFMFIETDRLINAHECCQECNETGEAYCEQCCIAYNSQQTEYLSNVTIINGSWTDGYRESFDYIDDDIYIVAGDPDYVEIHYNFTGVDSYSLINARMGTSEASAMQMDIWDGSNWTVIWSFSDNWTQNSFAPLSPYIIDNEVRLRVFGTLGVNEEYHAELLTLTYSNPVYMYCENTADTASIIAWHYTEYSIMPLFINLLPFLAIFAATMICIQYVYIWYKRASNGKEK